MDIAFRRGKLRKVCNDGRLLAKEYGRERALKIQLRLDQLRAARTLADMATLPAARCHELQGERRGQLAVDLVHPWRLIFAPLEWIEKETGGLDWNKVEAIVVEEIGGLSLMEQRKERGMSRNEYSPATVLPPGATLAETLEAIGMTQADLARRANRPIKTVNEIVQGKAEITADTAIQLERVLGIPAGLWQSLERNYRVSLARARDRSDLQLHVGRLREIPVARMEKLGWIPATRDKVEKLSNVLAFFGVASVEALEQRADARFRASRAFQANRIAVGAWLRRGHLEAQRIDCGSWDAARFERILDDVKAIAKAMPPEFASRLTQLCAQAGVAVVYVPELPGTRLWGATRWVGEKAIIQLSLRYRREDHFWFTFFHEAAHVLLHGKKELFIETGDDRDDEKEREANRFASDFLAPSSKLYDHFRTGPISAAAVERFARRAGVSPGIIVGRLQYEGLLPRTHLNGLVRKLTW